MARFGSLGTQYFNNSGEPLISGRIYFYESGTTTPKNTYADINLTILNTNPVILTAAGRQPNVFFDGVAKAILADADDVVIETRDPVGQTDLDMPLNPWLSSYTYSIGNIVEGADGSLYQSLQNSNLNHDPTSSPLWWGPWPTPSPVKMPIQNKSANYTVVLADLGSIINVTANSVTITFDPSATLTSGFWCWVINSASNSAHVTTLDPTSPRTIDGTTSLALRRGEGAIIENDGTNLLTAAGKKMRGYAENLVSTATRPTAAGSDAIALGVGASSPGVRSFVGGGELNEASGDYSSVVGGFFASAPLYGKQSLASGGIAALGRGSAQCGRMVLRGVTTNGTPLVITSDAQAASTINQIILPNDSTHTFSILVVARRADADGESAGYKIEGVIDRNANAGTTALVGSPTVTVLAEDTAAWNVTATADTANGGLAITVTGEAAKTIHWVAISTTAEVSG